LSQAPQRTAVFGGPKHTKEPPCSRSQVEPPATSQPAPVTGLQEQGILQSLSRQEVSAVAAALTLQVSGSPVPSKQGRQSPSSLQSASSWQHLDSAQVPQALVSKMPLQSTGSPPPVPVDVLVVVVVVVFDPVVFDPVVFDPVVFDPVVIDPVVTVAPPAPVAPPALVEADVVSLPQARGTRGAIAAATRIQE
jgi:hypothetical protein